MSFSYYTKEGLQKLRAELNQLKDVERPLASKAIAEARDKGDLSENAEYDAAKEAQGLLELKISKMEETLANARLIDESQLDSSKVLVLSKVKIKNTANNINTFVHPFTSESLQRTCLSFHQDDQVVLLFCSYHGVLRSLLHILLLLLHVFCLII